MNSDQTSKLNINGKELPFTPGETVLDVAQRNRIEIPTLCHLSDATPTGACRMCVVEVEKARTLVAACAAPATQGLVVRTESDRVVDSRRKSLQLLLASGKHDCEIGKDPTDWGEYRKGNVPDGLCPASGECKLQKYAFQYGVTADEHPQAQSPYPMETVNPFIVRDFSRCIHCGRCVQACNEIQVNNAISYGYRGRKSKIVASGDGPLAKSDCVFCGECVQTCPVGALVEKDSRYHARPWNTTKVRTTCSYCGVGCQMYLHVKNKQVVKVTGVEGAPPNHGRLCVKGRFGYDFVNSPERLTSPLIKENGEFRKASWDEALGLVAERLGAIKEKSGSQALAVLASARISDEENYIAQKFARAVLETNNVDHCARLCHASTVAGLATAFGSGAMTNPIRDVENADVILLTGANPTENHPVMGSYIKQALKSGKTKLIVVDPRNIGLTRFAEIKARQKPGTDVAWINGMMQVIIRENLHDKEFISERTEDFELIRKEVEPFTPEYAEKISGIPADDIVAMARLYAQAPAASIIYAMGITQHSTGTDNVKSLANLAMLCGNMGKPGGGVNPLRGQNNVQGACDMGSLPNVYPGYQKVADEESRKKFSEAWGTKVPAEPGLTIVEIMNAAYEGKIEGVYIVGENPMVSDPDLNHTEESLKKLPFLVVQDIFLTETARLADVVLPGACFGEKDGTFTNTERKVLRVRAAIPPPGETRQDWDITCDIARRMGYEMAYDNSEAIFREISEVTPSYAGISYDRIESDGLQWPCPSPEHPGTPILHTGKFARGKGKFHAVSFIPPAESVDETYPLLLTTGRILYQYHTGSMSMKSEGLNDCAPECFAEINSLDADRYDVVEGDLVEVVSRRGKIAARARVSDKMMPGSVFIPFHYAQAAANRLTNAALDPVCKIPELKVCAVSIRPKTKPEGKPFRWGQLDITGNTGKITRDFLAFLESEKAADKKAEIDEILKRHHGNRGAIIPVLQQVQTILGYLPPPVQHYIAMGLNVPSCDVYGIVSFYAFFSQVPCGRFMIKVCMGTACYVLGAGEITRRFEDRLGIPVSGTTEDRMFSLETVRCLGACGIAPVIMVNDDTYGGVSPSGVDGIIEKYRNQAQETSDD